MSGNIDQNYFNKMSGLSNMSSLDPDEQFVLDIIKSAKVESIQMLIDSLRLQESKSTVLIRLLERYKQSYEKKDQNK